MMMNYNVWRIFLAQKSLKEINHCTVQALHSFHVVFLCKDPQKFERIVLSSLEFLFENNKSRILIGMSRILENCKNSFNTNNERKAYT